MTYIPAMDPLAIEERKSWQYRAIAFLHANQSKPGAFLIATLGRLSGPPYFHTQGAKIDRKGRVMALYNDGSGFKIVEGFESVDVLNDVFRGLAGELNFTEGERVALFDELRRFIIKDERATSNLDGGTNYRKGRN